MNLFLSKLLGCEQVMLLVIMEVILYIDAEDILNIYNQVIDLI